MYHQINLEHIRARINMESMDKKHEAILTENAQGGR